MLTRVFGLAGWPSAQWLSSGVYVDGELQEGELGPWSRVLLAARYGELRVVLQEMTAETVIGAGLPPRTYPIGVLTTLCGNNESCLLSEEASRERRALDIVIASMRNDGLLIVNADDYDITNAAMNAECEILPYALHADNPLLQRHLADGGRACWVAGGNIVVGDQRDQTIILDHLTIPATLQGTLLYQIQNLMAAVSAAVAVGIDPLLIRSALADFATDPAEQPGATNVLKYNGAMVIVDSPELVASLRQITRSIRHIPHRRTLVICGSLPRLSAAELPEAGRILGGIHGVAMLHGDHDESSRMSIIKAGIASATVPPILMNAPNEERAVDHVLNTIGPDDIALVLADDANVALSHLWPAPVISVTSHRRKSGT
ncbi:MAG: hypothetical protein M9890_01130 [Thermomicrobiales bacterium]|nr:hypothetical protein [Thermomicrobiales bacterium]